MYPTPTKCHVCGNQELEIIKLACPNCGTVTEGRFIPPSNPFAGLTDDQMQFILAFVRCEGKLNRLEEELNLSYPTLRNRLNEVISALGYEPGREEVVTRAPAVDRAHILEELAKGNITAEEAQAQLTGKTLTKGD